MLTIEGKYPEELAELDRIVALATGWQEATMEESKGLWRHHGAFQPLPHFSSETGWAENALTDLNAKLVCRYDPETYRWTIEIESVNKKRRAKAQDTALTYQGNDWGFAYAAALAIKAWYEAQP